MKKHYKAVELLTGGELIGNYYMEPDVFISEQVDSDRINEKRLGKENYFKKYTAGYVNELDAWKAVKDILKQKDIKERFSVDGIKDLNKITDNMINAYNIMEMSKDLNLESMKGKFKAGRDYFNERKYRMEINLLKGKDKEGSDRRLYERDSVKELINELGNLKFYYYQLFNEDGNNKKLDYDVIIHKNNKLECEFYLSNFYDKGVMIENIKWGNFANCFKINEDNTLDFMGIKIGKHFGIRGKEIEIGPYINEDDAKEHLAQDAFSLQIQGKYNGIKNNDEIFKIYDKEYVINYRTEQYINKLKNELRGENKVKPLDLIFDGDYGDYYLKGLNRFEDRILEGDIKIEKKNGDILKGIKYLDSWYVNGKKENIHVFEYVEDNKSKVKVFKQDFDEKDLVNFYNQYEDHLKMVNKKNNVRLKKEREEIRRGGGWS